MNKITFNDAVNCPCGSGVPAYQCCFIFIDKGGMASSPEQLMRSRYAAYTQHAENYILNTWHESTRPIQLGLDKSTEWSGLKVLNASSFDMGVQYQDIAFVEFIASFNQRDSQGRLHKEQMHERSRFIREAGVWFYVDGEQIEVKTEGNNSKIGRNVPCRCGSGRKFKKCCGKS